MARREAARYAVSMVWPNGVKTVNLFWHEDNAREYVAQVLEMYTQNHVYIGEIVERSQATDFSDSTD